MRDALQNDRLSQLFVSNSRSHFSSMSCKQLLLRGVVISDFLVDESGIWQKDSSGRRKHLVWKLEHAAKPDDVLVEIDGFSADIGFDSSGLWLLTKVERERTFWRMVAFLKFKHADFADGWFEHQHWLRRESESDKVRSLAVLPRKEQLNMRSSFKRNREVEYFFTI
jgi:hypothetical protein